jgi:hypothetical protein
MVPGSSFRALLQPVGSCLGESHCFCRVLIDEAKSIPRIARKKDEKTQGTVSKLEIIRKAVPPYNDAHRL